MTTHDPAPSGRTDDPAPGSARSAEVPPGSLDTLAGMTSGVWLVVTHGSRHLFDLERWRYQRLPGPGSAQFAFDREWIMLGRIVEWPAVGGMFILLFDDPAAPHAWELWRRSSPVKSITPHMPGDRAPAS